MTEDEKKDAAWDRYRAAMHGVQTAVAYEQGRRGMIPSTDPDGPKHLRVGVNSAMVNDAAVTRLLIAKGIITELEYVEAVADEAERELARYMTLYPTITFA